MTAMLMIAHGEAAAQEVPLGFEATQFFRYNVENVVVDKTTTPWQVKVIFSVTNPTVAGNPPWDIKSAVPFTFKCGATPLPPCPTPAPSPSLTIDIGWNTKEFVNTGSFVNPVTKQFDLSPIFVNATNNRGTGAAMPIRINALTAAAQPCGSSAVCPGVSDLSLRFWVSTSVPPSVIGAVATNAVGTGTVGMEGHPVWPVAAPTENVPVKSVFKSFPLTDTTAVLRRKIVDFDTRCHNCHDGTHSTAQGPIPRLAMHGGSRNEEPGLCVICHNPNQTDIPFRLATCTSTTPAGTPCSPPSTDPLGTGVAPEVSIDFKRMVHEIHAGGFRRTPFKVVGFNSTVTDFSGVQFPARLSNCYNCHIDYPNGRGTFELSTTLRDSVLGSTVKTGGQIGVTQMINGTPQVGNVVDLDPTNNLRITPIASVCSACHDGSSIRGHMRSNGAVFGATQSTITPNPERCLNCHGPGREEDVRRAHEVSSTSIGPGSGGGGGGDD